jgi:hypothetical protein
MLIDRLLALSYEVEIKAWNEALDIDSLLIR